MASKLLAVMGGLASADDGTNTGSGGSGRPRAGVLVRVGDAALIVRLIGRLPVFLMGVSARRNAPSA